MRDYIINIEEKVRFSDKTLEFSAKIIPDTLMLLVEDAKIGYSVYELLQIRRPKDILNYLWVEFSNISENLLERLDEQDDEGIPYDDWKRDVWGDKESIPKNQVPYNIIDKIFYRGNWDDRNQQFWFDIKASDDFKYFLKECLHFVIEAQQEIIKSKDIIIKHEIDTINKNDHILDFNGDERRLRALNYGNIDPYFDKMKQGGESAIKKRDSNGDIVTVNKPINFNRRKYNYIPRPFWTDDYYQQLIILLSSEKIKEVSMYGTYDYYTNKAIFTEQRKRVDDENIPPENTLKVAALSDGEFYFNLWGAELTLMMEGLYSGDLFIYTLNKTMNEGFFNTMSRAGLPVKPLPNKSTPTENKYFKYLFLPIDHGDIEGYSKKIGDGWVLYSRDK